MSAVDGVDYDFSNFGRDARICVAGNCQSCVRDVVVPGVLIVRDAEDKSMMSGWAPVCGCRL